MQKTMLYCPQCDRRYERGTQRFCTIDSARLLPAPVSRRTGEKSQKVFAHLLRKTILPVTGEKNPPPAFVKPAGRKSQLSADSKVFQSEDAAAKSAEAEQPSARPIKSDEISSSRAALGDQKTNTNGRGALSRENTQALLGQTKERADKVTDLTPENTSSKPVRAGNKSRLLLFTLGAALLAAGIWAAWHFFSSRLAAPNFKPDETTQTVTAQNTAENATAGQPASTTLAESETASARRRAPPADTDYFQNSRENLQGEAAKNYLGFSLYYPKGWAKTGSDSNFIDLAKKAESGTPVEQVLVSWYESQGTFAADGESFPRLVEDANKKLSEIVPNYRFLSAGETAVNDRWRAYEMRFEGAGETRGGEKIKLWGRRLFIPAARAEARRGFVVTLLATSLSPDVKSADDVGVKGESAKILETFEPSSSE